MLAEKKIDKRRSNKTPISYRPKRMGEEAGVVNLVLKVFTEFVAPRYSNF
jgi:hypothetical protein